MNFSGEDYFTTKLQLWQSLQTYEKISLTMQKRPSIFLNLNEYVPETFKLDEKIDRDLFFNIHKRKEKQNEIEIHFSFLFFF